MLGFLKRWPVSLLVGLVCFLIFTASFVFYFQQGINSPDEAANLLFARAWRDTAHLSWPVAAVAPSSYPFFARSTAPVGNQMVPSGFVGVPIIYGSISYLLGDWVIFYLTIFLTIVAALAWRYLISRLFSIAVADLSFWFFLLQPAVLYYAARGLFPNLIVWDLILIFVAAVWQAVAAREAASHRKKKITFLVVLAALALMAAVVVRPPEALGLLGIIALAALIFGDRWVKYLAGSWLVLTLLAALLIWYLRARGLWFASYNFLQLQNFWSYLFPFGINFRQISWAGYNFLLKLFAPWIILAVGGFVWLLHQLKKNKIRDQNIFGYLFSAVLISVWLLIMYGSWSVHDNPANAAAITLGSSYVRYWLPILVLATPFAALGILALQEKFFKKSRWFSVTIIILVLVSGVARATWGMDGLLMVGREVRAAAIIVKKVKAVLPTGSVLAVRAWDKHFVGVLPVLQPFPQDILAVAAARELITAHTPVWAFIENLKEVDLLWLQTNGLAAHAVTNWGGQTLYELNLWKGKL